MIKIKLKRNDPMASGSKGEQGIPTMSCGKSLVPIVRAWYSSENIGSQGVQARAAETGSVGDIQTWPMSQSRPNMAVDHDLTCHRLGLASLKFSACARTLDSSKDRGHWAQVT